MTMPIALLLLGLLSAALAVATTTPPAGARGATLMTPFAGKKYKLRSQVTTSGISAGAFTAVQFGFAYSAHVVGTGVMAGGPFYCAQGSEITALTACMSQPSELSVSTLVAAAQSAAANGQIDPLSNLGMWSLYSGLLDFTVDQGVVTTLQAQLTQLGVASANLTTEYYVPSGHCVPTDSWGNTCMLTETPWINDCAYDGVGHFLNQFYPNLQPKGATPTTLNLITIDLDNYMPSGWTAWDASMDSNAYLYVPPQCATGNVTCSLHIVWHGCQQYYGNLGNVFMLHAGYVQWASTNNLIMLFPQATETLSNPSGCFDWWGYVNADYAFKNSVQMSAVRNVAVALGAFY